MALFSFDNDQQLIQAVKENKDNFKHIYNKYRDYCIKCIKNEFKISKCRDDIAFDFLQESMSRIYENIITDKYTYNPKTPLKNYMAAICRYVCSEDKRKPGIKFNDFDEHHFSSAFYPDYKDISTPMLALILEELEKLSKTSPKCYELLVINYYSHYQEKANKVIMQINNYSTIKNTNEKIRKCMTKLTEMVLGRKNELA